MSEGNILAGRRILVVEDEFLIATGIAEAIEDAGAVPLGPCADLKKARQTLDGADGVPDAAILDLNLKGASVVDLARELKDKGTVLIYHTGYTTTVEREGLPEGSMTWKPMSGAKLMEAVAAALQQGGSG